MNVAGMTLLEDTSQAVNVCSTSKAYSGHTSTLNPEASVFHFSVSSPLTNEPEIALCPAEDAEVAEVHQDRASPFMNGDVKNDSRGASPTPAFSETDCRPDHHDLVATDTGVDSSDEGCTYLPDSRVMDVLPTVEAEWQNERHLSSLDEQEGSDSHVQDLEFTAEEEDVGAQDCHSVETPLEKVTSVDQATSDEIDTGQEVLEQGPETNSEPSVAESEDLPEQQLSREEIKEKVAHEIEFFFSRENWTSDSYLISQMDSDQYVPIFILASCSLFKKITKDHNILLDAFRESPFVQLDEENKRVRPNFKRCIVILREIPSSTPVSEVQALFDDPKGECPKVKSCEFVHNDSWYVTFESDEDAQEAYRFLRETVKVYNGRPILARIKANPVSRLSGLNSVPPYGGNLKVPGSEPKEMVHSLPPPHPFSGPMMVNPGPIPTVPTPPAPPAAPYNPHASQNGVFYATNNVNHFNYAGYHAQVTQTPTAFFYPNPMVSWGPTYDINQFLQYNGLMPKEAIKMSNVRPSSSNSNRRSKHRGENRYEKERHLNSGTVSNGNANGVSGTNSCSGHFINRSQNRSQCTQSPVSTSGSQQNFGTTGHSVSSKRSGNGVAATCPTPPLSGTPVNNHSSAPLPSNTFAQNDLSIASQSSLYTSFSPPAYCSEGSSTVSSKEKGMGVSSLGSHRSGLSVPHSSSSAAPHTHTSHAPSGFSDGASTGISQSISQTAIPSAGAVHPIPGNDQTYYSAGQSHPQPGRSSYSDSQHPAMQGGRDALPPRQMPRGRRRGQPPIRKDDDHHSGSSNSLPTNTRAGAKGVNNSEHIQNRAVNSPHSQDLRKPQFDLQPDAFPPLRAGASEESGLVAEETNFQLEKTSQPLWTGSDSQKFSDIMKGAAKPKTISSSSISTVNPKESSESACASSGSPVTDAVTCNASLSCATTSASVINNSSTSQDQSGSNHELSSVPTSQTSSLGTELPVPASMSSSSSSTAHAGGSAKYLGRDQRGFRDDRRGPTSFRKEGSWASQGPGRGYFQRNKDAAKSAGGKENRPVNSWTTHRSCPREVQPDAEGWITKCPREARSNRENRQHSHTGSQSFTSSASYHNSSAGTGGSHQRTWSPSQPKRQSGNGEVVSANHVNGESSPPSSPKPDLYSPVDPVCASASATKSVNDEHKPETEGKLVNSSADGEHKTSWAKMALASKDNLQKLSAELKEKDEQEKLKKNRLTSRPSSRASVKLATARDRESKPFRRDRDGPFLRDGKLDRGPPPTRLVKETSSHPK